MKSTTPLVLVLSASAGASSSVSASRTRPRTSLRGADVSVANDAESPAGLPASPSCANPTCEHGGRFYCPGERFINMDGCNSCMCAGDGLIACTKMYCPGPDEEPIPRGTNELN
mmetsp:Transcript_12585/g.26159  ORF Transcript_12585/g.26159 Transcript_12585/m.26159 type:complete len:114 (-) Transcript_12585:334-675(-)